MTAHRARSSRAQHRLHFLSEQEVLTLPPQGHCSSGGMDAGALRRREIRREGIVGREFVSEIASTIAGQVDDIVVLGKIQSASRRDRGWHERTRRRRRKRDWRRAGRRGLERSRKRRRDWRRSDWTRSSRRRRYSGTRGVGGCCSGRRGERGGEQGGWRRLGEENEGGSAPGDDNTSRGT